MTIKKKNVIIRDFGLRYWEKIFYEMNNFTKNRDENTLDEIWFVEHYPIFTHGKSENDKKKYYIQNIPVMYANRGGKMTYHGPGQQIIYLLLNLRKLKINIKKLLFLIANIILSTLKKFSIFAHYNTKNPGIYVNNKKICSIGLCIHKGCCLHGFALNVNMNLSPFKYIVPCGDHTIIMTKMTDINKNIHLKEVKKILIKKILLFFNMKCIFFIC